MAPVVVCVVGTRPEAIKMAPVIARLRREGTGIIVRVLSTGQHRGLLDQALGDFGIGSDEDLGLMVPNQRLADLTARAISALSDYFERTQPDLVLAQGDTTTVLCSALACHYHRIAFGHVEAGLRTGRAFDPFPEEKNRQLTDHLSAIHFAPTKRSRSNLLREGISDGSIHVTGNTVIDALLTIANQVHALPVVPATARFALVTAHRRESFGEPLDQICQALLELVSRDKSLSIVYPVHPNPNVRTSVNRRLAGRERIHLIEPVSYPQFVALMKAAHLILTDSGGVQEEAPTFGKPVLVLREFTERPEAVEAGTVQVVGTDRQAIVDAARALLDDESRYAQFARAVNPYGDGWAAERIARVLLERFGLSVPPQPPGMSPAWLH